MIDQNWIKNTWTPYIWRATWENREGHSKGSQKCFDWNNLLLLHSERERRYWGGQLLEYTCKCYFSINDFILMRVKMGPFQVLVKWKTFWLTVSKENLLRFRHNKKMPEDALSIDKIWIALLATFKNQSEDLIKISWVETFIHSSWVEAEESDGAQCHGFRLDRLLGVPERRTNSKLPDLKDVTYSSVALMSRDLLPIC